MSPPPVLRCASSSKSHGFAIGAKGRPMASSFAANSAPNGGAIYNDGQTTVNFGTLSQNKAELGGGIYNDNVFNVNSSKILHNTASDGGGGIFNDDETVNLNATSVVNVNTPDNCEPLNTITGCAN